ncbi:MAG TPA: threonine/serine exporter, partial [Erysipelotrichaceae bacterium]|nr:threonine/serine exporter [Erysipelotrichaceae bacterium]
MNTDQLLDVASYAGKLLIESGAEIYRVEETMVRLCTSFSEVEDAQSFVTTTGIMFSITVASKTHTKILRVHTRGVDLNCIDKINSLSRETAVQNYTIEELALKLREIENEQRYSF